MPKRSNGSKESSANVVHLSGWLVVGEVQAIPLDGRQALSIRGHLHMHKPRSGKASPVETSYPVLFTGIPAEIVLEWAQVRPDRPVKMVVSGRLFQKHGECLVLVRFVEILEAQTGPLDPRDDMTRPTPPHK